MKIDFVSGAKNAQGVVVIIDVFRAFSVACYCLNGNPEFLLPVGSIALILQSPQQGVELDFLSYPKSQYKKYRSTVMVFYQQSFDVQLRSFFKKVEKGIKKR